jgi:hypothetical protein
MTPRSDMNRLDVASFTRYRIVHDKPAGERTR